MQTFLDFLANPVVQVIGWTLSVIIGFMGFDSWLRQVRNDIDKKKYENANKEILEQAQRNWEGKFTQEQIDSMKQELKHLEESINRDIPQKARRIFLEDQLSALADDLARNYLRYNDLTTQLGNKEEKLPDQVQRAIENKIMPSYLEKQRQQKTTLTVIGSAIAIFFFVNLRQIFFSYEINVRSFSYSKSYGYPFGWILVFILGVLCFAFLESVVFEKLTEKILSLRIPKPLIGMIYIIVLAVSSGFWVTVTRLDRYTYDYVTDNGVPPILVIALAALTIVGGFAFQLLLKTLKAIVKKH